jgi:1-acyl-sn-glycerol-3-phosphate acyltransferase
MALISFALGVTWGEPGSSRDGVAAVAAIAGLVLGMMYWHRYRGLGFATFMIILAAACVPNPILGEWSDLKLAIACGSLSTAFACMMRSRPWRSKRSACLVNAFLAASFGCGMLVDEWRLWGGLVYGILALFAVVAFFRPAFEFACEPLLWLMYRVRAAGPGVSQVPRRGPCIVIANHACWFDPLFLVKVLPRPITAMMISRFYDLPVLRPLLRHIFHTIRVPDHHYRKEETPEEIHEAIAALDRGECLVLFPEGFLRRTDDRLLRRFGRGIWQILAARPDTPVFCCWIEGAWGSYTSHFDGPPTKNKRRDFRRPITVAVSPPIRVDRAMLAHHLATRLFLMNRMLDARQSLGLPEAPPFEVPAVNDDGNGEAE